MYHLLLHIVNDVVLALNDLVNDVAVSPHIVNDVVISFDDIANDANCNVEKLFW